MPYHSIVELPNPVREHLPDHAQEIYKEAFNNALVKYEDLEEHRGDDTKEEIAHKVAWSAVKKSYKKRRDTGNWVKKN